MTDQLTHQSSAYSAYLHAKHSGNASEVDQSNIAQDPEYSYLYARDLVCGTWTLGEDAIAQSPEYSYLYARDIINGQWPPGEAAITHDAFYSFLYARQLPV